VGPDGSPLSITDLPSPAGGRWVIRRKALVVAAVRGELLSVKQACERYNLTFLEYLSWERAVDRFGVAGLRTTKVQEYRRKAARGSSDGHC
jgi:hypothetical protein